MLLHLEPDRTNMPRVANLGAIECGDPQEHAGGDPDVVRTLGIETPRDLEHPAACRPTRAATDVSAVTGVFAGDDHTRDQGVDRITCIELRRVRQRLVLAHPPARPVAFADLRPDIDTAHR